MRRLAPLAGIVALLASGCGGEAPVADAPSPGTTVRTVERALAAETHPARASQPARPLTPAELQRVLDLAGSLERGIERFDRIVANCNLPRPACIERAWLVVFTELELPLYYLVPMKPGARGCDLLASATAQLDGFVLGARQIDYGPPGETGQSESTARFALVGTLPPLPDELRSAATAPCR